MSLSNYAENKLLDHVLKVAAFSVPANLYVALSLADPTEDGSGLDEPAGGAYARVQCNAWDVAANRATSNTSVIQFPRATDDWGAITHWALFDASSGGNMLAYGALTGPSSLTILDTMRPRIVAGGLDIAFQSGGFSTYLANELLDHLLKVGAYSVPTDLYLGFSTANPGDSGAGVAEPAAGYVRTVQNTWDAASGGATANTNDFEANYVASGNQGTLTHVCLWDALTTGNLLAYAPLAASIAITEGLFPEFLAGELDITLT
jgi:hypothetical protein